MHSLIHDLRYGARMLVRHPTLTGIAVLTLGLGVGASTAIFTVLNAVVLRDLPYPAADRLAAVWVDFGEDGQSLPAMSPLDFRDLQQRSTTFESLAAGTGRSVNLVGEGDPEQVQLGRVTANFFSLFGAEPVLGRGFLSEEEAANGPSVAVLGHNLWQRRFAGDPGAVGKTILVDGNPMEVVGVMPADFHLLIPPEALWLEDSDLWIPLQDPYTGPRNRTTFTVMGRLRKDVTFAEARQEMTAMAARLREEHEVHALSDTRIRVVPLHLDLIKGVRPSLLILAVAVALVLLIACGNVGNLLLAHATGRDREMSVRIALGASRGRLLRQALTESALLAAAGGVLGLLLAHWGVALLLWLGPSHLPRLGEIHVDGASLAACAVIALSSVFLFGLMPASRASRGGLELALRSSGGSSSSGGTRFLNWVVVAEVALSVVLLIGAGLLVRSYLSLREVRPGFDAADVVTFRLSLPRGRYPDYGARADFYDRLEEQLRALPGVQSVGCSSRVPLASGGGQVPYAYDERTVEKWESVTADERTVTPTYFETLGTRLLSGRPFDERDRSDTPLVVIVDEVLAKKAWPGQEAVGRQIQLPFFSPEGISREWHEVVGVVEHARLHDLSRDVREQVFFPHRQGIPASMDIAVRATVEPSSLSSSIRNVVQALDKNLPIQDLRPMAADVGMALSQARFTLVLVGAFATIALALALIGLYGVVSYAVGLRIHDLGLRMALGAQARDLFGLVLGDGLKMVLVGVAVGLAASLAAGRALQGLLYEVGANDPWTFGAATLLVAAVTLLACQSPARRACRIDPVIVLRGQS